MNVSRILKKDQQEPSSFKYSIKKVPFRCNICQYQFMNPSLFKSHLKLHEKKKMIYLCDICFKTFTNRFRKAAHDAIHSKTKTFECKTCLKSFPRRSKLEIHRKVHYGKFMCRICYQTYSHEAFLHLHSHFHNPSRPYHCKKCDLLFAERYQFNLHILQFHDSQAKAKNIYTKKKFFCCKVCHKIHISMKLLKKHEETHANVQKYHCEYCSESFFQLSQLNDHQTIHTEGEGYVCDVCKRGFKDRRTFAIHQETHKARYLPQISLQSFRSHFGFKF